MVIVQASKFPLPSSPSPTSSILFDPTSLSLALMHFDSSISLYPSIPQQPPPSSLPSKPQTLIPPPSSSSSFLVLRNNQSSEPTVLFLVASPYLGGAKILLKLYVLDKKKNAFAKAPQVCCSQKGLGFVPNLGVLLDVDHGVSLKIVGSVNFFCLYSVSSRKVWVFALKLVDGEAALKMMRCAVIECAVPVWSISVSFGFLILGQDGGVRVFSLKQLAAKGKVNNKAKSSSSDGTLELNGKLEVLKLPNDIIGGHKSGGLTSGPATNGFLNGKIEKHNVSVKPRSVRWRKDSDQACSCFVPFKSKDVEGSGSSIGKATSIQALSSKKFMILDSTGDLHVLSLSNPGGGSNIVSDIRKIPYSMKVQNLAVLPDISLRTQTVWVSDGLYSVHVMSVSDIDDAVDKVDEDGNPEKSIHFSVIQVIFAGEKIQDLKPSAANCVLIVGNGNAYSSSILCFFIQLLPS